MIGVKACAAASGAADSLWATDPHWSSVVLAMPMDGANNSTTFTDMKGKTVTRYGNTVISTAQSKSGGSSAFFDGTGDYLHLADSTDWDFGTGNFSVECWIYLTGYAANNDGYYAATIVGDYNQTALTGWTLNIDGTSSSYTALVFRAQTPDTSISRAYSFSLNQWYHVAAVRSGTTVKLFVNGQQIGNDATLTNNMSTTNPLYIGTRNNDATYPFFFRGYIDDLRLTKGVARYTANFTPQFGL